MTAVWFLRLADHITQTTAGGSRVHGGMREPQRFTTRNTA